MQDAWQLFLEYNQEAMRHEVMDNIEDLAEPTHASGTRVAGAPCRCTA